MFALRNSSLSTSMDVISIFCFAVEEWNHHLLGWVLNRSSTDAFEQVFLKALHNIQDACIKQQFRLALIQ
jgi:hypothetical protein